MAGTPGAWNLHLYMEQSKGTYVTNHIITAKPPNKGYIGVIINSVVVSL